MTEVPQPPPPAPAASSDKDWLVTLLLAILVGALGIHRFYAGKIGTGILMLLTAGGCGVWQLIDIVMVAVGAFTDADGNKIVKK